MKSVLIVEDESTTRKLLANFAMEMGIFPVLASDGLRAWEILRDNPHINAVITDYQMPNMDGITLVKNIRSEASLAHLPIFLVSAYITVKQIGGLLQDGVTRFIPKPVKKNEIQEYLYTCIITAKGGVSVKS